MFTNLSILKFSGSEMLVLCADLKLMTWHWDWLGPTQLPTMPLFLMG